MTTETKPRKSKPKPRDPNSLRSIGVVTLGVYKPTRDKLKRLAYIDRKPVAYYLRDLVDSIPESGPDKGQLVLDNIIASENKVPEIKENILKIGDDIKALNAVQLFALTLVANFITAGGVLSLGNAKKNLKELEAEIDERWSDEILKAKFFAAWDAVLGKRDSGVQETLINEA